MSLELSVLTPENAQSVEQARAIWMEEAAGVPDQSGQLVAYAKGFLTRTRTTSGRLPVAPMLRATAASI